MNPSNAFWFGWGGLEKVGDFILPPLPQSLNLRPEPPSCLAEPPSGLAFYWAGLLAAWPFLGAFVDAMPKPFTATALYMGKYAYLRPGDPYYLSG